MVLFRTDGNPNIASGHVMRCLSLADAFQEYGWISVFVTADTFCQDMIKGRGYECIVLHTVYDSMEQELHGLLPLVEKFRPHYLILDSYFVTSVYMNELHRVVPVVYLDDLNAFDYPVDVVVNYNLYANDFSYPSGKQYLIGPKYALLRKEFQKIEKTEINQIVKNVLISTGGADHKHVALRCVHNLQRCPVSGVTYHIVLGAMNPDIDLIERIASKLDHVVLYKQISNMCAMMLQCDVAISAAGSTLYELCACGIPTVTYVLADNQKFGAAAFEKMGIMLCAGNVRDNNGFIKELFFKLNFLIQNYRLRKQMAEQMKQIVDGNGAVRLADRLIKEWGM